MDTLSRANQPSARIEQVAQAPLPTRHGMFQLRVFRWDDPSVHPSLSREHCALIMGDVRGRRCVAVRVHSECLTGEVFSSLKCDCREQFDHAQAAIAKQGFGVILYLRQEGRGIGLANKVRAYALQAMGADTVEANELLHLPVDARTYDVAAGMLRELGIESVELMTNNPAKVDELRKLGIVVEKRLPVLIPANPFSASYLEVKRLRMQHELPDPSAGPSDVTSGPKGRRAAQ
jgi:GTP cyclohydrolase II